MTQWTKDSAPKWAPNAIRVPQGWADPNTGEVLVGIGNLQDEGTGDSVAACGIRSISWRPPVDAGGFINDESIYFEVEFDENVMVPEGGYTYVEFNHSGSTIICNFDSTETDKLRDKNIFNVLVFSGSDISLQGNTVTTGLSNIFTVEDPNIIFIADENGEKLAGDIIADVTLPDGTFPVENPYPAPDYSSFIIAP